jgi:adenosylmethionine-8-amino-7-oxononanoate aminotransferase
MTNAWVERDAAIVWHGFTQMSAYADNAPLVIDRAEGRELIDVDGRRYLDAISSLWVNTLGHHVPELDAALIAQAGKVAHSTMLGNGNTAVIELAEALARVVPVERPHFLFAADGAVAVEQALKIAFQYWANRGVAGRTQFLALGDAYHGDTVGSLSLGDGGVFSAVFEPLCFPVVRTPGYADPGWAAKACAVVAAQAAELAAVVIEPLVQGASGMLCADPADVRALGEACRANGVLLICDEVATGSAASDPTSCASARASPAGISPCRPRWPRAKSSTPSWARTSGRKPSTTATPTGGTPWRRRWRWNTCG